MMNWTEKHIRSWEDWVEFKSNWKSNEDYGAFDTEASGLNIKYDIPFLFQGGWANKEKTCGFAFAFFLSEDFASRIIKDWHSLAKNLKMYAGANVKFDMHMLYNIGHEYEADNLVELQTLIRLGNDNLQQKYGGVPLGLKDYAAKYVTPDAKMHDALLTREKTTFVNFYNNKLYSMLNESELIAPTASGKWTKKYMEGLHRDKTTRYIDLGRGSGVYRKWESELPKLIRRNKHMLIEKKDIPYNMLDKDNIVKYGLKDVVYTIEATIDNHKLVHARGNMKAFKLECDLIKPLFNMERTGFTIDKDYVLLSNTKTRNYIRKQRKKFQELTRDGMTSGQSVEIIKIIKEKYDVELLSTDKDYTHGILKDLPPEVQEILEILGRLRSLEKWFSTYIYPMTKNSTLYGEVHTQISSASAVSGRVGSNFQQFPKGSLKTAEGVILFEPRRSFVVPDDWDAIIYLDYSQVELRIQALYTMLLGAPDINLCRAYIPYECHDINGVVYDYKDNSFVSRIKTEDWFTNESNELWHPTDVHGATTKAAFDIDETHPDYKVLRGMGKQVNFAKNYGATEARIRLMFPDLSEEDIKKIDQGYYKAFPGLVVYQNFCKVQARQEFAENLWGARYYGVNAHILKNMLVQGSAAYILKEIIVQVCEYLEEHSNYIKFNMQIHDELSFLVRSECPIGVLEKVKEIMEGMESYIPLLADIEFTLTNWADKKEVDTFEQMYTLCNWS